MKILVIDIETTGFVTKTDAIVEIGLVLADTDTRTYEVVFDKVVKGKNFNPKKHSKSWIFSNSNLTIKQVEKAKPLATYQKEIQQLLDKYLVTAFNKSFDMRFMQYNGFFVNETKCLMESSKQYCNVKDKNGRKKKPNVEEAYKTFFPNEKYVEAHRGADDAVHETKMLFKMCDLKESQGQQQRKLKFD